MTAIRFLAYCIPAMSSSDRSVKRSDSRLVRDAQPAAEGPPADTPLVDPMVSPASFKSRAYTALKNVIVSLDVYRSRSDVRLDERRLALDFGISRTPVREA